MQKPLVCAHGKVQDWADAGEDDWSPQYCHKCTHQLTVLLLRKEMPEIQDPDAVANLILGVVEGWLGLRD